MSPLAILFSLLAVVAGFMFPFQAGINAQLGRGIGGPIAGDDDFLRRRVSSFLSSVNLFAFRQIPAFADIARQPLYLLLAGGVARCDLREPRMSFSRRASARAPCFVSSSPGSSLARWLIDRFGLFGLAMRELTFGRVAGVFLVLASAP